MKSEFTENLISLNQLAAPRLKKWLIKPGMGFGETEQWWAKQGVRPGHHEGLDLVAYLDEAGGERRLGQGIIVPPLFRGHLVNIINDFLGETVIVDHGLPDGRGLRLHGFYAHLSTIPSNGVAPDRVIQAGEGLGTIAPGNKTCPPHLHISTAWVAGSFPLHRFSWPDFADREGFRPCDPMLFF